MACGAERKGGSPGKHLVRQPPVEAVSVVDETTDLRYAEAAEVTARTLNSSTWGQRTPDLAHFATCNRR